jgi:hypothetical protein
MEFPCGFPAPKNNITRESFNKRKWESMWVIRKCVDKELIQLFIFPAHQR